MKKFCLFFVSAFLFCNLAKADKADLTKIEIYISKPSKIRMEYTAPEPLLIVGNGDYIIYNDKELDQITNIDYKDIPATMILTKKISFNGDDLKVVDFYKDSGQVAVTVETPKTPSVKPITLVFDQEPFRLKQWKVIDPQNIEITVSLFDIEEDTPLGNELFKFDKNAGRTKSKTKRK